MTNDKQQTAVDSILAKLNNVKPTEFCSIETIKKWCEQAKEMEREQQPIKVKAIQDDSYHWYVIPNELYDEFLIDEQNEDMIDSGEFDAKWDEYRTGGDLNLIQLYTYGGNK